MIKTIDELKALLLDLLCGINEDGDFPQDETYTAYNQGQKDLICFINEELNGHPDAGK